MTERNPRASEVKERNVRGRPIKEKGRFKVEMKFNGNVRFANGWWGHKLFKTMPEAETYIAKEKRGYFGDKMEFRIIEEANNV